MYRNSVYFGLEVIPTEVLVAPNYIDFSGRVFPNFPVGSLFVRRKGPSLPSRAPDVLLPEAPKP